MDRRTLAAYAALVLVWGWTWAAIRVGVHDVPPWIFAFDRAILAALGLTAVALIFRLPFPSTRNTLIAAALTGAVNSGVSWAVIFWAERFVPSGLVAVFGSTAPIWTALLAHFLVQGDRLSVVKILAVALGFGGILALVGSSGEIEGGPAILAAVLLAVIPLGWAGCAVVMVRLLGTVSPIPAIAVGTATGGIFLIPFAVSELGQPAIWTPEAVIGLLYLSFVGSGVGLVLNLWLYRRLRPTTIALSQLLITVQAVLIGAIAFREQLTVGMLMGSAMVLGGIALDARSGRVRPAASRQLLEAPTPGD